MKNELFIGISITVATLVVIIGILFLQQATLIDRGLRIVMEVENTRGVASGSEVIYRGVHAGTVTRAELDRDLVRLQLSIKDVPALPKDSRFVIEQKDLLSGNVVQIYPGSSSEDLRPGAVVQGSAEGGMSQIAEQVGRRVDEVGKRAVQLEEEIGEVLETVDALLGEETRDEVLALLQESREAAGEFEATFEESRQSLARTLQNLEQISEETREPLSSSISHMERGSEELVRTLREIREVSDRLDTVIARMESGEGTVGKMVNDPQLYRDLRRTMNEMNSLIADIKENPKKYISISIF